MIPKKIHYLWFGEKELPYEVKKCIKSWEKYCPDFEIIRWDESNFNINCNSFVKNAYINKKWAFVSDYARLKVIFENGGIYLDTDVELLKSIDSLLDNKAFFGVQQEGNYVNTGLGFGATKGNIIVEELMKSYDNLDFNPEKQKELACPIINTEVMKKFGFAYSEKVENIYHNNATIYPPKYFDPIAPGNNKNLLCDDTYSIHHYSASWMNNKVKLKRKIINLIGQNKINMIKRVIKYEKK